jgi:catechol 2,3-dioxygenase-like lactoylglutathione lyase family enzyme
VPDCDKACDWYQKVFGFRRIRSDRVTDRAVDGDEAPIFKIYGNSLQKVKGAWLACGNGVGFEVFEFIDPACTVPKPSFEYTRGGFFHIAVTTPDPDATAQVVKDNGGKQIGTTVSMYGEKALYVEDPWGNVIECLSCSFEQLMGNRG